MDAEPFNLIATAIFAAAILHTFAANRITAYAHARHRKVLLLLGEVELVSSWRSRPRGAS